MPEHETRELNINADRILEAISKIGYKPASAIMDIVDNSISAQATNIIILLKKRDGYRLTQRNSAERILIIDNGHGMSVDEIHTALDLGSNVNYEDGSLSKFGLGLKSAGLHIGRHLAVVSKKDNLLSPSIYIDRDYIRDNNLYCACSTDASDYHNNLLSNTSSGTIIDISNLITPQDSISKIKSELKERLGVTYYHFLTNAKEPVSITLSCEANEEKIIPIDIMFEDTCLNGFDEETWEAKRPCMVFDKEIDHPFGEDLPKIRLQAAIFPKSSMANYAGFTEEERKQIRNYKITRNNSGCFVFRNGRLIRWADNIGGIGRDDIPFRAKLTLTSDHDEAFHVDVSKQRLEYPEDFLNALEVLFIAPLGQLEEANKICTKIVTDSNNDEGAEIARRLNNFDATTTTPPEDQAPRDEKKKRHEIIVKQTKEREEQEGDTLPPETIENAEEDKPEFRWVRYSDRIMGMDLLVPGQDQDYGPYVRINKNHTFYSIVLQGLPAADKNRIAIEIILFAMAAAQNNTIESYRNLGIEETKKLFDAYREEISFILSKWVNKNMDIF